MKIELLGQEKTQQGSLVLRGSIMKTLAGSSNCLFICYKLVSNIVFWFAELHSRRIIVPSIKSKIQIQKAKYQKSSVWNGIVVLLYSVADAVKTIMDVLLCFHFKCIGWNQKWIKQDVIIPLIYHFLWYDTFLNCTHLPYTFISLDLYVVIFLYPTPATQIDIDYT